MDRVTSPRPYDPTLVIEWSVLTVTWVFGGQMVTSSFGVWTGQEHTVLDVMFLQFLFNDG